MKLVIDGQTTEARPGSTILETALDAGIYIPAICHHPDLPKFSESEPSPVIFKGPEKFVSERDAKYEGCGLCIVEVEGVREPALSCVTEAEEGMTVRTNTQDIKLKRQEYLATMLRDHPRACLLCAQKEGCPREPCSADVPLDERCCPLLGRCELEKVADFVGVRQNLGRYKPLGTLLLNGEPLFKRDYNLCIGCTRCVRACRDLRGVEALGYAIKNGSVHAGTLHGPTLKDAGCRFCGACVEVCPTGALMDPKPFSPSEKEDILVPCRGACPGGIDVPAYVRAVSKGDPDKALSIIYSSVPFPGILGMVCHHPCEDVCRRSDLNEPVAICDLKRFSAENGKTPKPPSPPPSTGKRVAVVGSGPAGLTAAHYLRMKGHQVTVFECEEKPGGMLRYSIPRQRLPKNVLERDISVVLGGVELKTGVALGRDFQLSGLFDQGYDSVFLATGAGKAKKLDVPGRDCEGAYLGVEFLKEVNSGRKPALGKKVVVIGGGNVALDVALCCLRLGASDVKVVCLENESEMPAFRKEIEAARDEDITIVNSWGPKNIESHENRVKGIALKKCIRVFDEQGNFSPQYDESEMEYLPAENVILATGQEPDKSVVSVPGMPDHESSGLFLVKDTATSIPMVFAGGDATRGSSSVIEAVADGKNAADHIDRLLGGEGIAEPLVSKEADPCVGRDKHFYDRPRTVMPCVDSKESKKGFAPVELGYNQEEARLEASRCVQCDLRLHIQQAMLPPEKWISLDQKTLDQVPEKEGVYQLTDEKKIVTKIKGTQNLLESLATELANESAKYFCFEEDPMYTKRENELIQQHLQRYGELPSSGEEDLDELF